MTKHSVTTCDKFQFTVLVPVQYHRYSHTHVKWPSIHPSFSAYPGPGRGGSNLSRKAQTFLSPANSSAFPGQQRDNLFSMSWVCPRAIMMVKIWLVTHNFVKMALSVSHNTVEEFRLTRLYNVTSVQWGLQAFVYAQISQHFNRADWVIAAPWFFSHYRGILTPLFTTLLCSLRFESICLCLALWGSAIAF